MSKSKWIMKQYWRIGTIRTLLGLALGMLVLGRFYYVYIPPLADLGIIGALLLGTTLLLFFLFLGWIYDVKAKMWSQKTQVGYERNPYQYVPELKDYAFGYPFLYSLLGTIERVLVKKKLNPGTVTDLKEYLGYFFSRLPVREDICNAMPKSRAFLDSYLPDIVHDDRVPISVRAKLGFETQVLRLSWIQSLTGMFQDALVFGILYITVLLPGLNDPFLKLLIGTFLISLPLYLFITVLGWYYDKKLKIWSPDAIVKVERNPYTFVPSPREKFIDFPFLYSFCTTMREVFLEESIDTGPIDKLMDHLHNYIDLSASREGDMETARKLRARFGPAFHVQGAD